MATEVTPDALAGQVTTVRQEREAHGLNGPFAISVHLPVFAWDGPDPWELIRDHHRYIAWKYDDMETARASEGDPQPPPPLTAADEDALRSSIVLGTPAQVAEQIDGYRRAAGGDLHFVARLYFPGLPWDLQRRALDLFAGEVAPAVRELAGQAAVADQGLADTGPAETAEGGWVVGIDIGGTFTDAIATTSDGRVLIAKVPSTPQDPGLAFEQALASLVAQGVVPAAIRMIFHGTTVATNALLTGRTAKVVLATTEGFRDILGYRNGSGPPSTT